MNFGIVYGISAFSLAQDIGVSVAEAKEYMERYFDTYRGVKRYMEQVVETAREKGYVETLMHRRRALPELKSSNFNMRSFGERVALNMPIQGTAADIMKLAMVRVEHRLARGGPGGTAHHAGTRRADRGVPGGRKGDCGAAAGGGNERRGAACPCLCLPRPTAAKPGWKRKDKKMHIKIVPMNADHLEELEKLERLCFSRPWSRKMLAEELENQCAAFLVAQDGETGQVIGYAGLLVVADEGYITNVAVFPAYRRRGVAAKLIWPCLKTLPAAIKLAFPHAGGAARPTPRPSPCTRASALRRRAGGRTTTTCPKKTP